MEALGQTGNHLELIMRVEVAAHIQTLLLALVGLAAVVREIIVVLELLVRQIQVVVAAPEVMVERAALAS